MVDQNQKESAPKEPTELQGDSQDLPQGGSSSPAPLDPSSSEEIYSALEKPDSFADPITRRQILSSCTHMVAAALGLGVPNPQANGFTANMMFRSRRPPSLWMTGQNTSGQLGLNDTVNRSAFISLTGSWSRVSMGYTHSQFIRKDGTLWASGSNGSGELGLGHVLAKSSPVQVGTLSSWSQIAGSVSFSAALRQDGTLWTWGGDNDGQLGLGNAASRSSPTQVGTISTWAQIATTKESIFGLRADGSLWSMGNNSNGQLGINSTINQSSPVQIGTSSNWSMVNGAAWHTLALKSDGTLWAWGCNSYNANAGMLGNNSTTDRSTPVQVGNLSSWVKYDGGDMQSIGLRSDGTLWAWGAAGYRLGLNISSGNRSNPTQIGTLSS